jgi:hypothetical protein
MRKLFSGKSLVVTGVVLTAASLLARGHAQARDRDGNGRNDGEANLMLALDLDYALPLGDDFIKWGGGGAVRIGTEVDLVGFTVTPELTIEFIDFVALPHGNANADVNVTMATGKAGCRIRFGKTVEPGLIAHIGVGHLGGDPSSARTSVAWDLGATLDVTVLPLLNIGLQVGLNGLSGANDNGWFAYGTVGVHTAVVL